MLILFFYCILKPKLVTFWYIPEFIHVCKYVKLVGTFIQKLQNQIFFNKGKVSFEKGCQSWRFELNFQMQQSDRSRYATTIAFNSKSISLIEKWKKPIWLEITSIVMFANVKILCLKVSTQMCQSFTEKIFKEQDNILTIHSV